MYYTASNYFTVRAVHGQKINSCAIRSSSNENVDGNDAVEMELSVQVQCGIHTLYRVQYCGVLYCTVL